MWFIHCYFLLLNSTNTENNPKHFTLVSYQVSTFLKKCDFRDREKEGMREGNIDQLPPVCFPTWN